MIPLQLTAGSRTPTQGRGQDIRFATRYFFDKPRVDRALSRARKYALSRSGALVRGFARKLIKPARRLSLGEMSPTQRRRHEQRLRHARKQGLPRPLRPLASARPGQPPRNKTGLLKNFIYFAFEPARSSVVVGPVALRNKRTAWLLEYGGSARLPASNGQRVQMRFRGNPFMRPALEQARPQIAALFRHQFH